MGPRAKMFEPAVSPGKDILLIHKPSDSLESVWTTMGRPSSSDWIVFPLVDERSIELLNDLFDRGWYVNDEDLVLSVDREALAPRGQLIVGADRRSRAKKKLVLLTNAKCTCRQRAIAVRPGADGRKDYAAVLQSNPGWDMPLGISIDRSLDVAIMQQEVA